VKVRDDACASDDRDSGQTDHQCNAWAAADLPRVQFRWDTDHLLGTCTWYLLHLDTAEVTLELRSTWMACGVPRTEPALRPIGLACLRHPFAPARRQVSPFDSERMQRISFSSVDEIDRIEAADNYV